MPEPQRDYPPPQAEVNTAREVTQPAAPQQSTGAAQRTVTDLEYREGAGIGGMAVGGARLAGRTAWRGIKGVWNKAIMPAAERLIPQGASEIGHALYPNSVYAHPGQIGDPAKPAQEGYGIHGPSAPAQPDAPAPEANGHQVFGPEQPANDNAKIIDMQPQVGGYDPAEHARSSPRRIERDRGGHSR